MLAALTALTSAAVAAPNPVVDPSYDYTAHPDVSIIDLDTKDPNAMTLNMMEDKGLATDGAVCLDGTAAGFYFAPSKGGDKFKNSWQLYFQGGGEVLPYSGTIDPRRAKNSEERLAAASGSASASAGPASTGHDCQNAVLAHTGKVSAPAQLPTLQERGN